MSPLLLYRCCCHCSRHCLHCCSAAPAARLLFRCCLCCFTVPPCCRLCRSVSFPLLPLLLVFFLLLPLPHSHCLCCLATLLGRHWCPYCTIALPALVSSLLSCSAVTFAPCLCRPSSIPLSPLPLFHQLFHHLSCSAATGALAAIKAFAAFSPLPLSCSAAQLL